MSSVQKLRPSTHSLSRPGGVPRPYGELLTIGVSWNASLPVNVGYSGWLRIRSAMSGTYRRPMTGRPARGSRVPLIKEGDQREWLLARAASCGFTVVPGASGGPNISVTHSTRRRFGRRSDGTTRRVTLQTAQFDGVLEVGDASALRRALTEGIGAGKGYGCGLLTLAADS